MACEASDDAFHTRRATYRNEMDIVVNNLSRWRAERLPPPHALQSNFDRAAATSECQPRLFPRGEADKKISHANDPCRGNTVKFPCIFALCVQIAVSFFFLPR